MGGVYCAKQTSLTQAIDKNLLMIAAFFLLQPGEYMMLVTSQTKHEPYPFCAKTSNSSMLIRSNCSSLTTQEK
jgi:hypothetical protein